MDKFVIRKIPSASSKSVPNEPKETQKSSEEEDNLDSDSTDSENKPQPKKKKKASAPNIEKLGQQFSWLDNSKQYLCCKVCNSKVTGNKFHLIRHEKTATHIKSVHASRQTPQITTVFNEPTVTRKHLLIKEAELRLCCYIAEHNLPMLLLDTLPLFNKEIYPDSDIAKGIIMKRLKATKLIVGVLGPAFQEEVISDLKTSFFSIIIDETTDISTKKCLVIVVRYWKNGKVSDKFLDLLEVEVATGEAIFGIIKELLDKHKIPYQNIIGFGADNASTMMGAVNGVQAKFKEIVPNIYIQGCSCHSLHLCSSNATKKLPSTLEQFVRDIYAYFAHSNKRCQELKECQVFANEKPNKMLYPCQTRWLSLKAVIDRILEHWNSLTLFFQRSALEDNLPSAKTILNALRNQEYKIYLLFLSYILDLITKVNLELQSETPKLPIFLNRLTTLYKTILRCFIKKSILDSVPLSKVNINDPVNYLPIEKIFLGAKVDALLKSDQLTLIDIELHNFRLRALDFLIELSKQLNKRFNLEDKFLKYAAMFTPSVALSGEIMSIAEFVNLFPNIPVNIEAANTEWLLLGDINIAHLKPQDDINEFWLKIDTQKNALGERMFPNLIVIVKVILSLPHSSATAERVFSQLNIIKTFLRNRLLVKTCAALLHIKDAVKYSSQGSIKWRPDKKLLNYNNSFLESIDV